MQRVFEGRAWVLGDHVDTDQILPGRYLDRPMEEVGRYVLVGVDPTFPERMRPGDLVVAGVNFGCGSSREAAVFALQQAGIAAVIARSFARIFYRNAINNGLPAAIVAEPPAVAAGDPIRLDLAARTVTNLRTGAVAAVQNLTGIAQAIVEAGGIVPYTLARAGRPGGAR
jgi:3-isopropylmalate/(R)-2-methylmalate dehydratase small subunit